MFLFVLIVHTLFYYLKHFFKLLYLWLDDFILTIFSLIQLNNGCNSSISKMYSMQIENSVGFPLRYPLLVVEGYDHWKVRIEWFLVGRQKCKEIWKFMKEGPHVPVRQMVRDNVAYLKGQDKLIHSPLIANDIEKIHADQISFSKMVFVVPLSLFENIKLFKSAKEIWDTLQDSLYIHYNSWWICSLCVKSVQNSGKQNDCTQCCLNSFWVQS